MKGVLAGACGLKEMTRSSRDGVRWLQRGAWWFEWSTSCQE